MSGWKAISLVFSSNKSLTSMSAKSAKLRVVISVTNRMISKRIRNDPRIIIKAEITQSKLILNKSKFKLTIGRYYIPTELDEGC